MSQDWKVHITQWLNVTQIPVLVVGFENLKNDTYTELKRMLDFLGYPYSEDNVLCAIKSPTETFHRKHKKGFSYPCYQVKWVQHHQGLQHLVMVWCVLIFASEPKRQYECNEL